MGHCRRTLDDNDSAVSHCMARLERLEPSLEVAKVGYRS
jgi:hypothetical protein